MTFCIPVITFLVLDLLHSLSFFKTYSASGLLIPIVNLRQVRWDNERCVLSSFDPEVDRFVILPAARRT